MHGQKHPMNSDPLPGRETRNWPGASPVRSREKSCSTRFRADATAPTPRSIRSSRSANRDSRSTKRMSCGGFVDIAADSDVPVMPARRRFTRRTARPSAEALVVDTSQTSWIQGARLLGHDAIAPLPCSRASCWITLNAYLKPHGLHFAVDPSTSSRATIGGMVGNNSAGGRIRSATGSRPTTCCAIDALLADGT